MKKLLAATFTGLAIAGFIWMNFCTDYGKRANHWIWTHNRGETMPMEILIPGLYERNHPSTSAVPLTEAEAKAAIFMLQDMANHCSQQEFRAALSQAELQDRLDLAIGVTHSKWVAIWGKDEGQLWDVTRDGQELSVIYLSQGSDAILMVCDWNTDAIPKPISYGS